MENGRLACAACGRLAHVCRGRTELRITCDTCVDEDGKPLVLFEYTARVPEPIAASVEVRGVEVPPFVGEHYATGTVPAGTE